MTLIEEKIPATAEQFAAQWCEAFGRALAEGDAAAAAALFGTDSHWRDIVSFTWHVRTFSGSGQIRGGLAESLPTTRPVGVAMRLDPAPCCVRRADVESVEAFFDFHTGHGRGRGVVRLVPDEHGEPRAWNLLTTLQELTGHEEPTGDRRPRGAVYSRNFGGRNWLDQRKDELEYRDTDPAVLVVGGGQAGLGIAARLRHLGVDTLVVDRMERIGDNWRRRYHSLALHNQVWVNHLPYLPFPDSWPVYVPKDKLANWFEAYAETMEINFWTATEFVAATYDNQERHWSATLRRADGSERVVRPRHIVIATGVSGIPRIPELPGLEQFRGEVLHSGAYQEGSSYAGRNALVFGTGNSGHDVAQDLYSYGASVTMVQRSPTTVVTVDPTAQKVYDLYLEDRSTADSDLVFASIPYPVLVRAHQLLTNQMREADRDLIAQLNAVGFRTDYGENDTGYQMKYLQRGGGYYLDVGCSGLIIEGKIGLVQYAQVERMTPSGAVLRDGTPVPADLVVFATGYAGQQEFVRARFGDEVAERVGPVWGYGEDGELRNMWMRTGQEGLWFTAGSLAQSRIYSKFLALQIKACEVGLIDKALPGPPR